MGIALTRDWLVLQFETDVTFRGASGPHVPPFQPYLLFMASA